MVHYNTAEQLYSQAPQSILEHVPGHLHVVDPSPAEMVAHHKGNKPINYNNGTPKYSVFVITISQRVSSTKVRGF